MGRGGGKVGKGDGRKRGGQSGKGDRGGGGGQGRFLSPIGDIGFSLLSEMSWIFFRFLSPIFVQFQMS